MTALPGRRWPCRCQCSARRSSAIFKRTSERLGCSRPGNFLLRSGLAGQSHLRQFDGGMPRRHPGPCCKGTCGKSPGFSWWRRDLAQRRRLRAGKWRSIHGVGRDSTANPAESQFIDITVQAISRRWNDANSAAREVQAAQQP
jgi:hypothetical protein